MHRSAWARFVALATLIALFLGTILTADAATPDAPLRGAAVSVVAFCCGHVLGDALSHPGERWQLSPEGTSAAFGATALCGAAVDPVLAIPLGLLSGALFWPDRGAS